MGSRNKSLLSLVFALLILPVIARAQEAGAISGTVSDTTGAVIPAATVKITSESGQSQTVTTDEQGHYVASGLPAGTYTLEVTVQGFKVFKSKPTPLAAGGRATVDATLEPSEVAATTTVEAQSVGQIETENAEVSGTITSKEVTGLMLNGRNFTQLIALTPGVSNQTGQDEGKVGLQGSAKYSVNGGRVEYNTFEVDGSDILNNGINASRGGNTLIVYPSLDALQEVKVLTSNYGAQYGRTASGTVLASTKSGSQTFHGNAYEFLRNEFFNARNFFDQTKGAPLYRRNDLGWTIGGPLYIPNVYNTKKDKTFFFWSEEFRFEKTPTAFNQAVPSLAERDCTQAAVPSPSCKPGQGDFSDVCPSPAQLNSNGTFSPARFPDCPGTFVSSVGGFTPFAGNLLSITPIAQALLNTGLIPAPNSTTGCNSTISSCYVATVSPSTFFREELVRLDHNFNAKTQLALRFIHDAWNTTVLTPQFGIVQNSFPTVEQKLDGPGISAVAHLSSTITNTLLNQFTFSFTTDHITLTDVPGPGVNLQRPAALDQPCHLVPDPNNPAVTFNQCPLGAVFQNGFGGKIPGIVIGGNNAAYGGNGFAVDTSFAPYKHSNPTYNFRDDVSKAIGKHTLQFGVQAVIGQQNELSAATGGNSGDVQGLLVFSNQGNVGTTGNAFADFLGGPVAPSIGQGNSTHIKSFQQDSAQFKYYTRYWLAEPYIQDDWRVTQRLTLNLGFRLSIFGNWYNKFGNVFNFQPQAFNRTLAATAYVDPTFGAGFLRDLATNNPIPVVPGNLDPRITNGLVPCGKGGSCARSHLWNPAPRIGFAWDPFGDSKTSLRAGYGIFFEHGTSYEANVGSLIGSAPTILSVSEIAPQGYDCIGGGQGPDCSATAGLAGINPAFPLNVTAIPTKTIWPYAQQWSFGVERQLATNLTLSLAYVGSKGTHLTAERQINQLAPLPASENPFAPGQAITSSICSAFASNQPPVVGTTPVLPSQPAFLNLEEACFGTPATGIAGINPNALRTFSGFGRILALDNIANSNYHAFQFTLRRSKGPLDFGVSYTYSHSIDNSSDRADATFVNSFNLRSNKASSNFDERHLVTVSYIYDLPFFRVFENVWHWLDDEPTNQLVKHPAPGTPLAERSASKGNGFNTAEFILGGWQLSGIIGFQSGTPFSVVNGASNAVSSADNAGVANGEGLGSYVDVFTGPMGGRPAGGNNGKSFGPLLGNPGLFVAPQGLTFGNAGRNPLNNPSRLNFDVALLKHYRVFNERDLEFRAEVFNIFNATQFRIYDPTNPGNTGNNVVNCFAPANNLVGPDFSAAGGKFVDATGKVQTVDCLTGNSFLHPVDAHRPRTFQFGMKFSF